MAGHRWLGGWHRSLACGWWLVSWLVVDGSWLVTGGWSFIVLTNCQLFLEKNCTSFFQKVSGFWYRVGICTKFEVSDPGTFLQNLKKNLYECHCGSGYVFQISRKVVVCGKSGIKKCTTTFLSLNILDKLGIRPTKNTITTFPLFLKSHAKYRILYTKFET